MLYNSVRLALNYTNQSAIIGVVVFFIVLLLKPGAPASGSRGVSSKHPQYRGCVRGAHRKS